MPEEETRPAPGPGPCHAVRSVVVDATAPEAYRAWERYEDFPRYTAQVRRIQRIGADRILWALDVAGRHLVSETRIVDAVPNRSIRWESRRGAAHRGEVRFDELGSGRTWVTVSMEFRPRGLLERLGARLGMLDRQVARALSRFRRFVETHPAGLGEAGSASR